MCGFAVTNKNINLEDSNFFCQKRGPDLTNTETINGVSFLHNLLHITGEVKPQPFVEGDVVCVLNVCLMFCSFF